MANTITLPSGLGTSYTYMEWDKITDKTSNQYKLRESMEETGLIRYDTNGLATFHGRYVVAVTSTFGNVGDYLDIKTANGKTIKAVIGDIKNQSDNGANQWGHNGGQSVVEFITGKALVDNPDSDGGIISIKNTGNYWTSISTPVLNNADITFSGQSGTIDIIGNPIESVKDKFTDIFQKIFIFLVLVFISVTGVYFFLRAFDINVLDKKQMISKVVEKKTGIDIEGVSQ